ncbi:parvalbumin alpha-like [Watersipora subatra]|uniref:parvalbumin alpha-like n=1 Tax=Watersipora subatra TaxID=2589382 RepID=UPI00355B0804
MADQDPEAFQVTEDKERELIKLWAEHQDADGERVPVNKVIDIYWNVGYILGNEYSKQLVEELTDTYGELVSYQDTKELFRQNMVKKLNLDFFKNLFRILDKNKQGIIPADNLKKILSQLPDTNEEEVDAMIAAIDDDGNGEVDFNEFYGLMCDG